MFLEDNLFLIEKASLVPFTHVELFVFSTKETKLMMMLMFAIWGGAKY